MPSNSDPKSSVNSGPGKLSVGTVPSSSLLVPGGGGGSGALALEAHINNPVDAHFAHAIGVDAFYPYPGGTQPILQSVGGVVAGEDVLDFINQFKALIPVTPNSIGFNLAAGVTSGIPNWGALNTILTGGYQNGSNVQFSHYILANGSTVTGAITGLLFPADRGILAFYSNASGDFLDGSSTLVAAISLNDTLPFSGPGNAAFNESLRNTQQVAYTASGSGLDNFSLTFRYPYLSSYTGYTAPPYGPFVNNFPSYQLAEFSLPSQSIAAGGSQNFLLVHWKESYATSSGTIQPAALTLGNLTSTNCYSATPSSNTAYASGSWDDNTSSAFNVNRHFIFRDTASGSTPAGVSFTSTPSGAFSTISLSGVHYYSSVAGGGLTWQMDVQASNLFGNSFQTGSVDSPPNVPAEFHSTSDPMQMDFSAFGGGILPIPYYAIFKQSSSIYSPTNSPAPGDIGEYPNNFLAAVSPSAFCPSGGYGQLLLHIRNLFASNTYTDTTRYLFDSYPQSGGSTQSTTTYEPFFDEQYRYLTSFDPTSSSTVSIIPAGGNVFPSATALVVAGANLQVEGGGPSRPGLCYPQVNYTSGYYPSTSPDYSGFPGSDGALNLRRYLRAFDTGVARSTGWIRLNGLAQAAFTTNAAYSGSETTGHITGGAIVQIKVPGASGSDWLDLGRSYGDPGVVGALGTSPFYGCSTAVVVNGSDVYVQYNTAAFTSNNGSGNFLLFVRVTFINNGAGNAVSLNQMQFYPPTFVPP